ncbi:aryl-alcohol dehydrogenase-like predicted oxidoreductase [Micromonospora jinlongensis]|uniref:Aryl-alcohol dehydrogenase-like predicted oxidoreductase n=1 Tax=Micromonospora jinlongensis TaxID=1287877 RepID=A0A7Y9X094_9ACTN|nr:aldo/keto reductase [Micromonospora jinlongensis]NYH41783.1 aryl-alcohol dehydrogenase-like predicted oxidoreductase [Micromonospora jinlongensis]
MTGLRRRRLGASGPEVSVIGLGAMGMSDLYGPADEAESVATLHAAIDAGVNLVDTADFYGSGHNEMLIGRVLRERRREEMVVSVKFGARRTPDGGFQAAPYDVSAAAVKDRLAYSLRRLGTDYIDIYRPSRLNPQVPVEETVGALLDMQQAGYIRHIGLSEVGADSIRRAAAVAPISDVQIEYSLLSRGPEATILPALRELGIGLTAYGVLSRGLLSGHWSADRELTGTDFRANSPRFQGEHLAANLRLVDALGRVAQRLGATTSQVAIAWVAAQGEQIVPLVGARRRDRLAESLAAADLTLDQETLEEIERAVPAGAASGQRYAAPMMDLLDSEK